MEDPRRASTPVIGEVLMVAVAVVAAVAVATFAFGYGQQVTEVPSLGSLETEFTDGNASESDVLRLTHTAGDTVSGATLEVTGATDGTGAPVSLDDARVPDLAAGETVVVGADRFAGVDADPDGPGEALELDGADVRLVQRLAGVNRTAVVYEWNGSAR